MTLLTFVRQKVRTCSSFSVFLFDSFSFFFFVENHPPSPMLFSLKSISVSGTRATDRPRFISLFTTEMSRIFPPKLFLNIPEMFLQMSYKCLPFLEIPERYSSLPGRCCNWITVSKISRRCILRTYW